MRTLKVTESDWIDYIALLSYSYKTCKLRQLLARRLRQTNLSVLMHRYPKLECHSKMSKMHTWSMRLINKIELQQPVRGISSVLLL